MNVAMHMIDLTGQTFGRWRILSRAENSPKGQARWLCQCECGTKKVMESIHLRRGISRSCGCLKIETTIRLSTKHGHASTTYTSPTYHTWAGMVARCTNPKHRSYPQYGGNGIAVCKRWLTFSNFLADMGEKPTGTSLDRIDSKKGYAIHNCRWATSSKQARNKGNNRLLTHKGKTQCVAEWAEELGIPVPTLNDRLLSGWDDERALSTPAGTATNNSRSRMLTFGGKTMCVAEWARQIGIKPVALHQRLARGWPLAKALKR
jgi:hypothetical protein